MVTVVTFAASVGAFGVGVAAAAVLNVAVVIQVDLEKQ